MEKRASYKFRKNCVMWLSADYMKKLQFSFVPKPLLVH